MATANLLLLRPRLVASLASCHSLTQSLANCICSAVEQQVVCGQSSSPPSPSLVFVCSAGRPAGRGHSGRLVGGSHHCQWLARHWRFGQFGRAVLNHASRVAAELFEPNVRRFGSRLLLVRSLQRSSSSSSFPVDARQSTADERTEGRATKKPKSQNVSACPRISNGSGQPTIVLAGKWLASHWELTKQSAG